LFSQSYAGYKFPEQKPQALKLTDKGRDVQKDNLGDSHIRTNWPSSENRMPYSVVIEV
jgi:hypothetical protein